MAADARANGLGTVLINRLSRQVGATAEWVSSPAGTRVSLSFPVEK
jgi:two-component sensor histidine kinase